MALPVRWGVEKGEVPEAHGPARLAHRAPNNKIFFSNKVEGEDGYLRLFSDLHIHVVWGWWHT